MGSMGNVGWLLYIVVICGMFYFIGIRPSQKERKKQQEMLSLSLIHI